MTAREMFEKLGYSKAPEFEEVVIFRKGYDEYSAKIIEFNKTRKTVVVYLIYSYTNSDHCSADMNELKAINKQVEELGWLDE